MDVTAKDLQELANGALNGMETKTVKAMMQVARQEALDGGHTIYWEKVYTSRIKKHLEKQGFQTWTDDDFSLTISWNSKQ